VLGLLAQEEVMTTESKRAACRGAHKNGRSRPGDNSVDYEDDERKERLKKLIRENVRPIETGNVFEVLPALAKLDGKRLKLIAEIFVAMRPHEPARFFKSAIDARADVRKYLPGLGVVQSKAPSNSESAERVIAALAEVNAAIGRSEKVLEDAIRVIEEIMIGPPRSPRGRRRKRSNVVPITRAAGQSPKAS
jgi:hypothetical protein